jgi:hypothetical protein
MPRSSNPAAMSRSDSAPAACNSSSVGARSVARLRARACETALPAARAFAVSRVPRSPPSLTPRRFAAANAALSGNHAGLKFGDGDQLLQHDDARLEQLDTRGRVALIRDTVSHCAPVLIAQNSSRRRPWAGPNFFAAPEAPCENRHWCGTAAVTPSPPPMGLQDGRRTHLGAVTLDNSVATSATSTGPAE